jgi:hypothetical protein
VKRTFVQAELFKERIDEYKDPGALLKDIEDQILQDPECGDVVAGTGGVRKMRIADPFRGKGKRGGFRVLYLDLPDKERTHLLYMYGKDEADNISSQGKKLMKQLTDAIRKEAR